MNSGTWNLWDVKYMHENFVYIDIKLIYNIMMTAIKLIDDLDMPNIAAFPC